MCVCVCVWGGGGGGGGDSMLNNTHAMVMHSSESRSHYLAFNNRNITTVGISELTFCSMKLMQSSRRARVTTKDSAVTESVGEERRLPNLSSSLK